jgi:hypothetical protein
MRQPKKKKGGRASKHNDDDVIVNIMEMVLLRVNMVKLKMILIIIYLLSVKKWPHKE